ncbi:hypothetical protein GGH12_000751 [Coemansia sp. RSA 1822]|nr:hypothetical protein LPJ76_001618 [Coemansia sp. RSA 638]KAJ2123733.1 hypothetical protein IW147_002326 [Coemansia sp. RSA 720]KAJ2483007.1 hypothetical protein IWW56_000690 [Coemansia sp. RSA 2131]KAJ2544941.1 hypothetical protein GGF49_000851 [Coemansia sp. RSA 1853]KAJ2566597.1 hypothetical protein GGH12_000751 [Coemansia sp. RSA 1822]KAJ2666315.1 Dolichyl-diphosphooligosaccharide-protein glycosyltransferase subunit dad1 [Coemansia sp. RSA 1199]
MDRTESLATSSYGSRPQFEREKERLIVEINQGMDVVNKNLVQLNQNLESAIALGSNFDRIARLWNEFGLIINPPAEEEECEGEDEDEDEMDADVGSQNDEQYSDDNSTHARAHTPSRIKDNYAESTLMDEDE